ncbi:ribonuclease H-like protein [Dendrothele bispora CBS 962.96]|uniref:Ribonuclease H-like protein n=1 Tax=Dendrothele bispora (strain CBS 962.96) TaxID=1314807 RepID=A0A4S8KTA4_DENBC|nr:ribonuclease H-like protein [Dendrothele bispora CBS 962.96]
MAQPVKPLTSSSGPLVWIDCEMTGLNPEKDKILEIAVLITDGDLNIVDEGIEYIVKTEKTLLDGMDSWCTKQHGESGLTKACLESPYTRDYVSQAVFAYIKKWVPEQRTACLAGNSVHADRSFLVKEMPEVIDWLHYRIESTAWVDVSSIKECVRRWYPAPSQRAPKHDSDHRALSDIRGSIGELKWYRENIFVEPIPYSPDSS